MAETEKKRTLRVPHVYTIILVLMAVFAVLTWVVPSGSFERQEVNGREVTVSGTYEPVDKVYTDEDGNEVTFEVIDALDHKGVHYLAVVEYTENEEDAEDAQLVILSVGEDDEGEYLDVVEDDETLLEVSKLFEQRLSDDYEID